MRKAIKPGHTRRQWEMKFFECGCKCLYCEIPLLLDSATKDHLIPVSRGGSDDISNIVPACFRCNTMKSKKTFDEFMRARPWFSKVAPNSTTISKPIQQASALLTVGRRVEKPKRPERVMSLAERDECPLRKLRDESEGGSWAWKNPA